MMAISPIGKKVTKQHCVLFLLIAVGFVFGSFARSAPQASQELHRSTKAREHLSAVAEVTWWSLDPTGYHPAVLVKIENTSGKDLSGQLIRLQGRFMDVQSGMVTVARKEIRQAFVPGQEIYIALRAPQPYQLPIDVNAWPQMECKVMCRVGNVGDEGTQTLIISKLESVTMTDDDAYQKLSKVLEFRQVPEDEGYAPDKQEHKTAPVKPLKASAASLRTPTRVKAASHPASNHKSIVSYVCSHAMPGIGDDFYFFEKTYGLPAATDSSQSSWCWASYTKTNPRMTVFTGSKGVTGKVDVLMLELPALEVKDESTLIAVGKSLSGKFKAQKLSNPTRSVRYLSVGRTQLVTFAAPSYQLTYLTPRGTSTDNKTYILILSKPAGPIETILAEQTKLSPILHQFSSFFSPR
ncbi:MAG: hypothetical protein HY711_01730 [Candidatus Melainabacteria bacterium]|nr:hypothetical protein [Candidatus Melainabacteria bacterium]